MSRNLTPAPFIQNHINWCWATVAKIVGFHYLSLRGQKIPWKKGDGICRADAVGLRTEFICMKDGLTMVDAWQNKIVEVSKSPVFNADGNQAEDDEGKARALRYVASGDPFSSSTNIITTLSPCDGQDLMCVVKDILKFSQCSLIGNYRRLDGSYHSVVLKPENELFVLYDPWDGYSSKFTMQQVFTTGFLSNTGPGVIQWIQSFI